jgi:hypothetical protein
MTPPSSSSRLPGPIALVLSFLVGSGCVGLVGGGVAFVLAKRAELSVRRGWNLVPVVVAAKDLSPGTLLTMENLSQRSIPEQFVTASVVMPEAMGEVIGRPVVGPVVSGDPLRWSFVSRIEGFTPVKNGEVFDACADEVTRRWAKDLDQTPQAQRARLQRGAAP